MLQLKFTVHFRFWLTPIVKQSSKECSRTNSQHTECRATLTTSYNAIQKSELFAKRAVNAAVHVGIGKRRCKVWQPGRGLEGGRVRAPRVVDCNDKMYALDVYDLIRSGLEMFTLFSLTAALCVRDYKLLLAVAFTLMLCVCTVVCVCLHKVTRAAAKPVFGGRRNAVSQRASDCPPHP